MYRFILLSILYCIVISTGCDGEDAQGGIYDDDDCFTSVRIDAPTVNFELGIWLVDETGRIHSFVKNCSDLFVVVDVPHDHDYFVYFTSTASNVSACGGSDTAFDYTVSFTADGYSVSNSNVCGSVTKNFANNRNVCPCIPNAAVSDFSFTLLPDCEVVGCPSSGPPIVF